MQRFGRWWRRTAAAGTKPQCQPIDLRCLLRGPLLRREKNKLIEEGGWSEREEQKKGKRGTHESRGTKETIVERGFRE